MSKKEKNNLKEIISNLTFPIIIVLVFLVIIPLCKCTYTPLFTGSNVLIDMKSIYKERHKDSTTYSFWTKHRFENYYDLIEINVACSNRTIAIKTFLEYKNNAELVRTWKNNRYLINRDSILPNAGITNYYNIACQPHIRYIYMLESAYPNLQGMFSFIEDGINIRKDYIWKILIAQK